MKRQTARESMLVLFFYLGPDEKSDNDLKPSNILLRTGFFMPNWRSPLAGKITQHSQ